MKNSPRNETTRRTIRINSSLADRLDKMAEKDNRTFNNMVETLLMRGANTYMPYVQ